jgi:hypothetical protein
MMISLKTKKKLCQIENQSNTEAMNFSLLLLLIQLCSVKTDLMEIGANSTLLVAKVNTTDAGNYTCSIGESQQYTVLVHVLNGGFFFTHK